MLNLCLLEAEVLLYVGTRSQGVPFGSDFPNAPRPCPFQQNKATLTLLGLCRAHFPRALFSTSPYRFLVPFRGFHFTMHLCFVSPLAPNTRHQSRPCTLIVDWAKGMSLPVFCQQTQWQPSLPSTTILLLDQDAPASGSECNVRRSSSPPTIYS